MTTFSLRSRDGRCHRLKEIASLYQWNHQFTLGGVTVLDIYYVIQPFALFGESALIRGGPKHSAGRTGPNFRFSLYREWT